MVTSVGELVRMDLEHGNIFQDHLDRRKKTGLDFSKIFFFFFSFLLRVRHLLKVFLFLLWVGVIKAHDQLALECELVMLVEQSSLCVANVQVSTGKGFGLQKTEAE